MTYEGVSFDTRPEWTLLKSLSRQGRAFRLAGHRFAR